MEQTSLPKWQQWLARGFGGGAQTVLGGLALVAILVIASMVANWADTHPQGPKLFGAPAPLLAYRVPQNLAAVPCSGVLCGVAAVVPAVQSLPSGAGFISARAQLVLPPPIVVQAPEGGYLQAVGVIDERKPIVQRPESSKDTLDNGSDFADPVVIALVHRAGEEKPIKVDSEGFITAWRLMDADSKQATVTWIPPPEDANADSTAAAKARRAQWNQLKFRSLQFQPVPRLFGLRLANTAQSRAIAAGSIAVLAWGDGRPALTPNSNQLVPRNGVVGVVRAVTSVEPAVELQVEVPRSTLYGRGHWLWLRMDGMPSHEAVLPAQINVDFFVPEIPEAAQMPVDQDHYTAERLAIAYSKLPREGMRVLPSTALDAACAQPAAPSHACVWAEIAGVAVPVQVSVLNMGAQRVGIRERGVFAGKSIAPAHWAKLPVQVRLALSGGDTTGATLARPALSTQTPILLSPLPASAVGQGVSTRMQTPQSP